MSSKLSSRLRRTATSPVYSNKIVGYSIHSRMKASLAVSAMRNAIALRSPVAAICHSDRGSISRQEDPRLLANNGLVGSMGRSYGEDNASMESLFALLQKNVLDRRSWTTRKDLRITIVTWIDWTYHRRRRQDALGRLTPVEFETIMTEPATQAA
jgi:putative transposase